MIQLNQTWQGVWYWEDGEQLPPEFRNINFILHVNFIDRHHGFEAVIEDDPEQLGFESKALAWGHFNEKSMYFSKIYQETSMYWPDINPIRSCPVGSEINFQGNFYDKGAVTGFWKLPLMFRRFDDDVLKIPSGSGTWSMKVL